MRSDSLADARWRRLGKIHVQDRHVECVGNLAVLFIPEEYADELARDVNLHGILLLWALDNRYRVKPKQIAEIFFQAPYLGAGQYPCSQVTK